MKGLQLKLYNQIENIAAELISQ